MCLLSCLWILLPNLSSILYASVPVSFNSFVFLCPKFRDAMSAHRRDQKICYQGLRLLTELTHHLRDQSRDQPHVSLQTSRQIATHVLKAFWWENGSKKFHEQLQYNSSYIVLMIPKLRKFQRVDWLRTRQLIPNSAEIWNFNFCSYIIIRLNVSKTKNYDNPTGALNIFSLWKIYLYLFIQIALKLIWLPYKYTLQQLHNWLYHRRNSKHVFFYMYR